MAALLQFTIDNYRSFHQTRIPANCQIIFQIRRLEKLKQIKITCLDKMFI